MAAVSNLSGPCGCRRGAVTGRDLGEGVLGDPAAAAADSGLVHYRAARDTSLATCRGACARRIAGRARHPGARRAPCPPNGRPRRRHGPAARLCGRWHGLDRCPPGPDRWGLARRLAPVLALIDAPPRTAGDEIQFVPAVDPFERGPVRPVPHPGLLPAPRPAPARHPRAAEHLLRQHPPGQFRATHDRDPVQGGPVRRPRPVCGFGASTARPDHGRPSLSLGICLCPTKIARGQGGRRRRGFWPARRRCAARRRAWGPASPSRS